MITPTIGPIAFTAAIPDADLADLRERLARTRWPDQAPGDPWAHGVDVAWMRELAAYWRDTFDWRRQESDLNSFPQFITELSGAPMHFLHVPGEGPAPLPLLLLHGWPGSVFEFLDLIPRLTQPLHFSGDPANAFTVIAPSLPGYGYSFRPGQKRFDIPQIADYMVELMSDVLGYERFAVQGGDWGAHIATSLGVRYANRLAGIHLNFLPLSPTPRCPRTPRRKNASTSRSSAGSVGMVPPTR